MPCTLSPIHEIQGAGHTSPLEGREVVVEGVVTAVGSKDEDQGLFLQSRTPDDDPATSEGVYVASSESVSDWSVGMVARARGQVEEWKRSGREADLTTTRILAEDLQRLDEVADLPKPQILGGGGSKIPEAVDDDELSKFQPEADAIDFLESLEGMWVEVREAEVVGPTTRFGEIVVVSGPSPSTRSPRGGLVLGSSGTLTERLMIGPRVRSDRMPPVAVGDRFTDPVVGVMDYAYGHFKIQAPELPTVSPASPRDETTPLRRDDRHLTVASFNVLNLSAQNSQEKFDRIATAIQKSLASPDIIALQEIQDDSGPEDDGVVTAEATLERLIQTIESLGGPRYAHRQIDPEDGADGGQPGGNIRVAFLFDPARVLFVDRGQGGPTDGLAVEEAGGVPSLSLSPGRIAPDHGSFTNSRKPLAGEFRFLGQSLFLVNLHLRSKGGDDPVYGLHQPPKLGSEDHRNRQAEQVHDFVDRLLDVDPRARLIVLGDTNDHEFRRPLHTLAGDHLINLVNQIPEPERYTYVYQGRSQVLDNLLVSRELAENANPEIDIVHIAADFPAGRRASDHDPLVVKLRF